jgi:hypothetical protein
MRAPLLPGDGVGEVIEFVRMLDRIGCRAPIGVEVFSDELAAMAPLDAARRPTRLDGCWQRPRSNDQRSPADHCEV